MARKRMKQKRRSCSLCKPGKTARSNRWKNKDHMLLRRFEATLQRGGDWSDH